MPGLQISSSYIETFLSVLRRIPEGPGIDLPYIKQVLEDWAWPDRGEVEAFSTSGTAVPSLSPWQPVIVVTSPPSNFSNTEHVLGCAIFDQVRTRELGEGVLQMSLMVFPDARAILACAPVYIDTSGVQTFYKAGEIAQHLTASPTLIMLDLAKRIVQGFPESGPNEEACRRRVLEDIETVATTVRQKMH